MTSGAIHFDKLEISWFPLNRSSLSAPGWVSVSGFHLAPKRHFPALGKSSLPRHSVCALRDGLQEVLVALCFRMLAATATVRVLREMLYGIRPLDAQTFGGVAMLLIAVAGLACVVPAWRASRLDAMQALRAE